MRTKLTKKVCTTAAYDTSRGGRGSQWLWDTVVPGLGLRLHPAGAKAWVFRYRLPDGQRRELSLGAFAKLSVEQARDKAKRFLGDVARDKDPVGELRSARHTVAELCAMYEARHLPKLDDQARPRRVVELLRQRWGRRPAASVKRAEVAQLHHEITTRGAPYEANRTVAIISKMWALAEEWGLVPEDHPNPARKITRNNEVKRDRWVTHAQLPALFRAIENLPNPWVRAVLILDLLTGCRKGELLESTWDRVDLDRRELRIEETKQGTPHVVPLSAQAIAILEALPRIAGNPHVFPGRHGRGHLVNIDKCWRKVRAEAGLPDVRLHDLRRTVGSWLAVAGSSLIVIGKALGHSQPSTTAIYARLSEHPVRDALERHGSQLVAVASETSGANVVPLREGHDTDRVAK